MSGGSAAAVLAPFGLRAAPAVRPWRAPLLAFLVSLAILLPAGWSTPPRSLGTFDQAFYATTAWDLVTHGVYSDGYFDRVDSSRAVPPSGMFLGPAYPLLLAGLMRLEPALRAAAACTAQQPAPPAAAPACPPYRGLVTVVNMALVAGALALLFVAARRIGGSVALAGLATTVALGTLTTYLRLLSLAMTESLALFLFAAAALAWLATVQEGRRRDAVLAGGALGLLVLTRPSHAVLVPPALAALGILAWRAAERRRRLAGVLAFAAALAAVTLPWALRNLVVLDRFALTAGYGPAVLIERLAYDGMTTREFGVSFLYWLPDFGDAWAERLFGTEAVQRLDWNRPGSFYDIGQQRRAAALAAPGTLDDRLPAILRGQLLPDFGAYLMATASLAWRGLFVGRYWGLAMLALLPLGLLAARRAGRLAPLLAYAAPAWIMLGVHAAASVNQERYNLALALGLSIAAGYALLALAGRRWPLLRPLARG